MRLFLTLLICLTTYLVNAQYYISDVAPIKIDQIESDFGDLKLRYEFGKAKVKLDSLSNYWFSIINDGSPTSSEWQNYYYCKIHENYKRFIPDSSNIDIIENLLDLKEGIKIVLPDDNPIWGMYYNRLASLFKSTGDFEKSRTYYLKAINNLRKDSTTIGHKLKSQSWLASLELKLGNNDKALEIYSSVIKGQEDMRPVDSIALAYTYYNMSRYYERTTDYETQTAYLNKSAKIIFNHYGEENKFYWFIQIGIGFSLYNKGQFEKALDVFLFLNEKYTNNESEKAKIGNNKKWIANCYRKLNQIEKAKEIYTDLIHHYISNGQTLGLTSAYNALSLVTHSIDEKIVLLNKAYAVCDKDDYCDPRNKAIIYKNLAIEYRKVGDLLKGLNYLNKALEIENVNKHKYAMFQSYTYNSLSLTYDNLGNLEKATEYAIKALDAHRVESKSNYEREAFLQSNLAYFLIKSNEIKKAEKVLDDAMQNLNRAASNAYDNKANVFKQTVYLYKEKKEYGKAFDLNEKCLEAYAVTTGKKSNDYAKRLIQKADLFRLMEKPDSCRAILKQVYEVVGLKDLEKDFISASDIPQAYLWLAFDMLNNNMNIEVQLDSLQSMEVLSNKVAVGCELIDQIRTSHYFEASEQNFIKASTSFLNRSIDLLYYSYERKPDEKTLALIFHCIEKSKSIAINRIFERSKSVMEKGVPLELVKREKRIISDFEQSFKNYVDFTALGDDIKAAEESKIMFSLQGEKDKFLDILKSNYPDYFQRRYAQNLVSLRELQKLASDQNRGFLQYHWTDKELYKFFVFPNRTVLSKLPSETILMQLDSLNSALISGNINTDEKVFKQNFESFKHHSSRVYNGIIGKEAIEYLPFNITVVPGGKLNGLSFDVLLKDEQSLDGTYGSLPYLINEHALNYVGSASQFAILQDFRTADNSHKYVGFAPSYIGTNKKSRSLTNGKLLYNENEVESVSSYFSGDRFLGIEATEARFKELISNYTIAHLALHGVVNDSFPLNSYLQFVSTDSLNDGRLYIKEISEMEINNSLMVLSACETNSGEEVKGEGLLGISRAFQIASCPNILMSNWLVDDKSASQLMQPFFKEISKGQTPANALRLAKLKFISTSSQVNAHPAYWAAFSYYGNPSYTFSKERPYTNWIYGLCCILGLGFFYRLYKNSK